MRRSADLPVERDDCGAVALELVLVTPFLFALLLSIASFGAFFSEKIKVTGAAHDAARTLALGGSPVYPAGVTPSGVVACAVGDTQNNSSVTLTTTYTFSIPFVPLGTKSITAKGTMRCGG